MSGTRDNNNTAGRARSLVAMLQRCCPLYGEHSRRLKVYRVLPNLQEKFTVISKFSRYLHIASRSHIELHPYARVFLYVSCSQYMPLFKTCGYSTWVV